MSMKRKALLVIAAAVAIAAIVVLTTGASAGTAGKSDQPGGGGDLVSCLASHGVQVPSDDPAALKQWLGEHSQDDPTVQAALQACQPPDGTEPGPTPAALVACLEQHRVDVPVDAQQDAGAFKQWLAGAMDQPTVQSAVDDCTGGPPPNGQTK
jgi:hypothetical protein